MISALTCCAAAQTPAPALTSQPTAEAEQTETTISELFEPPPEGDDTGEPETPAEEPADEEGAEPPAAEQPPDDTASQEAAGLKAALAAERKKRQELEAKLQAEPEKLPDPVEDPEGYAAALEQRQAESAFKQKADLSREVMMSIHDDYGDKEAVFMQMAESDPSLVGKLHAAANPAKFAYDTATDHLEVQKLRDPEYLDKLATEKAKEMLKNMGVDPEKGIDPDKPAQVVPDATRAPAAGKNTDPAVSEISEIGELFPE